MDLIYFVKFKASFLMLTITFLIRISFDITSFDIGLVLVVNYGFYASKALFR